MLAMAATSSATVVIVGNGRGPAATREVTNSANELVTGFGAFGVLNEGGIAGMSTTFEGLGFTQFGAGGGSVSTSTAGQFSFQGDVGPSAGNASTFLNQNIYLVVGFGGSDLATSTDLFIYKFDATFGDLNSPTPITQILTAADAPGSVLLGTEVGNPSGSSAGRYGAVQLVPEPSVAILGALGALGLIRRRR